MRWRGYCRSRFIVSLCIVWMSSRIFADAGILRRFFYLSFLSIGSYHARKTHAHENGVHRRSHRVTVKPRRRLVLNREHKHGHSIRVSALLWRGSACAPPRPRLAQRSQLTFVLLRAALLVDPTTIFVRGIKAWPHSQSRSDAIVD
jgi:hypothetical protein